MDRPYADEFYRSLPDLLRASYEIRRVNQFAAALAVVRWAKGEKAGFEPPAPPKGTPTPPAIAVTGRQVLAVGSFTDRSAKYEDLSKIEVRLEELKRVVPSNSRLSYALAEEVSKTLRRLISDPDVDLLGRLELRDLQRQTERELTELFRKEPTLKYYDELTRLRASLEREVARPRRDDR